MEKSGFSIYLLWYFDIVIVLHFHYLLNAFSMSLVSYRFYDYFCGQFHIQLIGFTCLLQIDFDWIEQLANIQFIYTHKNQRDEIMQSMIYLLFIIY